VVFVVFCAAEVLMRDAARRTFPSRDDCGAMLKEFVKVVQC
jgi:hypothetical protein